MDTINKKTTSQMGNQDDIHLFAERGGEGRGGEGVTVSVSTDG